MPLRYDVDLLRVRGQHLVDERLEVAGLGDLAVAEVGLGREAGIAARRERLCEDMSRDLVPGLDQLGQLLGVDQRRIDAGGRELVHEDVRDRRPVAGDPLEEAVAAADDEPFRELEADLLADPVDPRAR